MGLLEGKKLLITGVLMESSIAFHAAKVAQQEGAEVVLSSFGRAMKITQTIAKRLPVTPFTVEAADCFGKIDSIDADQLHF